MALRDAHGDVVLYAGEDDHPHLMAFAPPPVQRFPLVRFGDLAPRITIGGLVAQRAAWWLEPEELTGDRNPRTSGMAAFSAAQRVRARRGLPNGRRRHRAR